MEMVEHYLNLIDTLIWPIVVVVVAWLAKDYLKEFKFKHKDFEINLKLERIAKKKEALDSKFESVLESDRINEETRKRIKEAKTLADEIYSEETRIFNYLSRAAEDDSNSDGEYTVLNNGLIYQVVTIPPGKGTGIHSLYLPRVLQKKPMAITFSGECKPAVRTTSASTIEVEIEKATKGTTQIHILGI